MDFFCSNNDFFISNLKKLYYEPEYKTSPRNLSIHENIGSSSKINNPRDRIIFSKERKWDITYALGEFLWYICADNSVQTISYYAQSYDKFSDDGKTLYGAYGPRIKNGINSIISKLKNDSDTRQAVLLFWREKDMDQKTKDLPCTLTLQFFIRDNKLNLITSMRSNDIWLGSTNDIFCFTLLQEYISNALNIEIGFYQHITGSLHLYQTNIKNNNKIESIINSKIESIPMEPIKDLYKNIGILIKYEKQLRILNVEIDTLLPLIEKENTSDQIKDLIYVLICKKYRKLFKKDKDLKNQYLIDICNNYIKQECIKHSILSHGDII